jgi:hypothetical protein
MRGLGFDPIHSQFVPHQVGGMTLHDAKRVVHHSAAWSATYQEREEFYREVEDSVEELIQRIDDAGGPLTVDGTEEP